MRRRVREGREVAHALVQCFTSRDLLSYASAIGFQVLYALVPLMLAAVALLGFLGLEETWSEELAPEIEDGINDSDAFSLIDRTVESVLGEQRGLWLTFGIAFATWQVSSAIRAAMGPLNRIYGIDEDRPTIPRILVSLKISLLIMPLLVIGFGGVGLGGRILSGRLDMGTFGSVALGLGRYVIAVPILLAAVWLILRLAPAHKPELKLVSLGAGLIVGAWVIASAGFAFYVAEVASYETVFGGFAVVIVLITYLYILSLVFLGGAQLDALLRERMKGEDGE
jgi:membrane protein